jgi:vacuolar-type H+-ATPase subunit C/Vma6
MPLMRQGRTDLDFLGAVIHGRRSRLAEAERLDALCRIRTVGELVRAVAPEGGVETVADFQRRLVADLVRELTDIAHQTDGAVNDLLAWLCVRFQVENLKVLARGFATKSAPEDVRAHLISLPGVADLDVAAFVRAPSLEDFAALIPQEALREGVLAAAEVYRKHARSFFLEAGLDRGYLGRLVALARPLSDEDGVSVLSLAVQEVDTFHLMLVARGRFQYGLKPDVLAPFRVPGAGADEAEFSAMLAAADLAEAVRIGGRRALDGPAAAGLASGSAGIDPADLEALAHDRYFRIANAVFRRSHMGLGAVAAYAAIRRVELANLITLSEGIRVGMAPEAIRQRLIPRSPGGRSRV